MKNKNGGILKKRKLINLGSGEQLISFSFLILCVISFVNEFFDLPHIIFRADPTPFNYKEIFIEIIFILLIGLITILIYTKNNLIRKKTEEELHESEKMIRNLMENVPIGISISTPEGDVQKVNTAFWKIFGYGSKEEFLNTPAEAHYYNSNDRKRFIELNNKGLVKGLELQFKRKNSNVFWGSITSTVLLTEAGKTEYITTFEDITERKQVEETLHKSETNYRLLAENTLDSVWKMNENMEFTYINKSVYNMLGFTQKEWIGSKLSEHCSKKELQKFRNIVENVSLKKDTNSLIFEIDIFHKNGSEIPLDVLGKLLLDENNQIIGFQGNARDITERKLAEEQIKKDLAEKSLLLQEIYHRTKNNMAVISAMLTMQSRRSKNEYIKTTFKEINNKIKVMSLVHQKLYQAKDLSNINVKEYIEDLLKLIMQSYCALSKKINVNFEMQDIFILIDSAIPLGLIINELLSNIFKHAFPNDRKGEIFIKLFKDEDNTINLQLSDNGVGLPQNFNVRKDGSMGLASVFSIVERQLKGKISINSKNGLKWHIRIKDNLHKERV